MADEQNVSQHENLETPEQEAPQEEQQEEEVGLESGGFKFISPMAMLMFLTAGIIDLIGFIIACVGLDDFWILDITGLVVVGGLMFVDSGAITGTGKSKEAVKKMLKRLGTTELIEIIPWVGGISPSWLVAVFLHLKNK